jgi:transposase
VSGHVEQGGAQLRHLHAHWVKDLERRCMQAWPPKTPPPALRVIGVEELSIKKWPHRSPCGQRSGTGASDLGRGHGRTESDLGQFFLDVGSKKTARIRLALLDIWKAFRNSVQTHAPQAQVLFDKFHSLRHPADAMDQIRWAEYKPVAEKDRAFIKGQRYTLLSHRANLTLAGRWLLRKVLRANKRFSRTFSCSRLFSRWLDQPAAYPMVSSSGSTFAR